MSLPEPTVLYVLGLSTDNRFERTSLNESDFKLAVTASAVRKSTNLSRADIFAVDFSRSSSGGDSHRYDTMDNGGKRTTAFPPAPADIGQLVLFEFTTESKADITPLLRLGVAQFV